MDKSRFIVEMTVPSDFEAGVTGCKLEDGGRAAIMYDPVAGSVDNSDPRGELFVRLQSWNESDVPAADKHLLFRRFMGRRIRVTVEEI